MVGRARQPLSLRARAVALLAQRDHSELELRRKLGRIARAAAVQHAKDAADSGADFERGAAADTDRDAQLGADLDDAVNTADIQQNLDDVVVWLRAQGYLDESRFVESRVHARASRWGQRRIEQELAQHGLSLDAEQRATLAQTELSRACEQLRRKFGPSPETDPATEARQMRFLMGRGFGSELCRRAIRAVRAGEIWED